MATAMLLENATYPSRRSSCAYPNQPLSLEDLPRDCILVLLSFLRPHEIGPLSQTCSTLRRHCYDEWLWREYTREQGFDVRRGLAVGVGSWREMYTSGAFMVLPAWRWDETAKDSALSVREGGMLCTRNGNTGHNPSVVGTVPCPPWKCYFELQVVNVGKWCSIGFASQEFQLGSERNHTGKAHGTVAYYSDASIHKLFHPQAPCQNMPQIKNGDQVGCMLDPSKGTVDFFLNGSHYGHLHWNVNRWFRGRHEAAGDPVPQHDKPVLRPALSIGQDSIVAIRKPARPPPAALRLLSR